VQAAGQEGMQSGVSLDGGTRYCKMRSHVSIITCDSLGWRSRRLHAGRIDLRGRREISARKPREQGVEVEATPWFTRGVLRKAERNIA
jgi:hypothetical protein